MGCSPFEPPPLLFIEGVHGCFCHELSPEPPRTDLGIEWSRDTWKMTVRWTDQKSQQTCLKLDLDTARWAPIICMGVRVCLKSVWMLWWAHGSSWTHLICWEGFSLDRWRVTFLMGCILFSFPSISNLHTNVHQHFVEFVSNNSYHWCWRSSFIRSCRSW